MKKIVASTLFVISQITLAGPWMTGPLLAPAGKTVPKGHLNFEPYGFYSEYPHGYKNLEALPVLTVGVTDFMDLQTSIPYDYSWKGNVRGQGVSDWSLALGFQLLRQQEHQWLPDVRFVVQEVFPTGKFEYLNPELLGTDQTGIGSYQTYFGLNLQRLTEFANEHYLRSRLSLVAAVPGDVHVHGYNVFGGTADTDGKVRLGTSYAADLAFEYTLTQNWVPVFEVLYVNSGASHFAGNPGFTPGGTVASIGGGGSDQTSIAPALEYNFSDTIGVIAGVWFSVSGPAEAKFTTAAIAINYFL